MAPPDRGPVGGARIIVVLGPSGSGKSTVAALLAERLGWAFVDADTLHAPEAVARIAAGQPLTDAERAPWLERVAAWIDARLADAEPGIVACSALRRAYRDVLRRPGVAFAALDVPDGVLRHRLERRRVHFAGPELLPSQLATFEPLAGDEFGLTVDGTLTPEQVAEAVRTGLALND